MAQDDTLECGVANEVWRLTTLHDLFGFSFLPFGVGYQEQMGACSVGDVECGVAEREHGQREGHIRPHHNVEQQLGVASEGSGARVLRLADGVAAGAVGGFPPVWVLVVCVVVERRHFSQQL